MDREALLAEVRPYGERVIPRIMPVLVSLSPFEVPDVVGALDRLDAAWRAHPAARALADTLLASPPHSDAVRILGILREPRAVDLFEAPRSVSQPVMIEALQAIGGDRAVAVLLHQLKTESSRDTFGVAADPILGDVERALAKLGTGALEPLTRFLRDEREPEVRERAISLIARIGGDAPSSTAADVLYSAVDDPDLGVRRAAVRCLAHLLDARAVGPLLLLLADPPHARDALERMTRLLEARRSRFTDGHLRVLTSLPAPQALEVETDRGSGFDHERLVKLDHSRLQSLARAELERRG